MFKKPPVGSRPGTLAVHADAPKPRIRVFNYDAKELSEAADVTPTELPEYLNAPGIAWIDVQGLGDASVLEDLGTLFSIHPLALEDVVNTPQRPTTDTYEEHQVYISRMVRVDDEKRIDIDQVTIFIGKEYLLTFQERQSGLLDPVVQRLHANIGPIRRSGADYLGYAVIDTIVDHYYPLLDRLNEEIEELESEVMRAPTDDVLGAVNRVKRDLLELRRGIWPQRDAVNQLIRDPSEYIGDEVRVYLRDVYDHCVQIADVIDTYRELAAGLFNTYLSVVSNRMNEVMKVLTIMASIFVPLTFVAGIYGMNFEAMPELHWKFAYPAILGLMGLVGGGMLYAFWRSGWIGRSRR